MAINNKFVTSFSELYLGGPVQNDNSVGGVDAEDVVTWFVKPDELATTPESVELKSTGSQTTLAVDEIGHLKSEKFGNVYFKNKTGASMLVGGTTGSGETEVIHSVEIAALFALGLTLEWAKVPLVAEIGSISNESTVIDVPEFGERFKGKLRGQLDGGQLDTTIYWAPRELNHVLIRELAQTGVGIGAGIKWKPNDVGTDAELVVFNSFCSSFGIDTAFDDVAKANTTLVVDGSESFGSI
jgi:hypothetical protein